MKPTTPSKPAQPENFAAIIISHGRSKTTKTNDTLRRFGYTGKIITVVDDEDPEASNYIARFGEENVVIFSKDAVSGTFDHLDNFNKKNVSVYARNVSFDIAKQRGLTSFVQLDDDYKDFDFMFDKDLNIGRVPLGKNLDRAFEIMVELLRDTGSTSVAFMQGGDFIGGTLSKNWERPKLKRKVMNSFFCLTERPFTFVGSINEDVNAYSLLGMRGHLFLSTNMVMLSQAQTQLSPGGMSDAYLASGTYVKSFYTVMICPGSTRIYHLSYGSGRRIHHHTTWNNAVPKIIGEEHKKKS